MITQGESWRRQRVLLIFALSKPTAPITASDRKNNTVRVLNSSIMGAAAHSSGAEYLKQSEEYLQKEERRSGLTRVGMSRWPEEVSWWERSAELNKQEMLSWRVFPWKRETRHQKEDECTDITEKKWPLSVFTHIWFLGSDRSRCLKETQLQNHVNFAFAFFS